MDAPWGLEPQAFTEDGASGNHPACASGRTIAGDLKRILPRMDSRDSAPAAHFLADPGTPV